MGILVGLAIYNGATLPVTFPRALYRKLLGLPVTELSHIRDGWRVLFNGLEDLLTWNESPVEDVFVRTYEFSFDLWGTTINVDMEKVGKDDDWPKDSRIMESIKEGEDKATAQPEMAKDKAVDGGMMSPNYGSDSKSFDCSDRSHTVDVEARLVTEENREQYVKDYIFWLTDKSIRPQFEAFSKGFFACIDKRALSVSNSVRFQS